MPSFSLTVEVPAHESEDTAARLVEAGAAGVEERGAPIAAMPGVEGPAGGGALLVAWFGERQAAERAARALGLEARIDEVADRDWGEAWKRGLSPFSVGPVFVRPSWAAAPAPPGCAEVVLDPGMAFGTGTHPTTALCLEALAEEVSARPGLAVLDVGTGSGLLAIAAARLGAGRVAATDEDPVALRVARENAARNGVAVELGAQGVGEVRGPFDLVVANILAATLVELAPALAAQLAPAGLLLLSGILDGQEAQVRRAFRARGLSAGRGRRRGEWWLLAFRRDR